MSRRHALPAPRDRTFLRGSPRGIVRGDGRTGAVLRLLLLSCAGAASAAAQPSPSERSLPGAPEVRQQPAQVPTGGASPQQAPSEAGLPAAPEQDQQTPAAQMEQAASEKGGGLLERDKLLGELGGLRTRLEDKGVSFGLQELAEVFGNATGGVRQGAIFEGALLMSLAVDTEKLISFPGGKINVSAYQIHGSGLSGNNLGNLNVISSIEAPRSTRLFELWYEQSLANGKVSVRVGQQAADQEFIATQYGALFLNAGFGWPTLPALDLPSGGPAYPLATPGVRVKLLPTEQMSVLAGVYNGDPSDNRAGTSFRLNKGVFAIGEVQYALNGGEGATGLPGIYKIGGWYNSNNFADQRFGYDGLSLADPDGVGEPRLRRNNWSLYAVADQLIYREPGTKDQGIGVFARAMGAPGDRNAVNVFLNAGAAYKGIVPGRVNDTLGLGVGYARISDTASKLDADTIRFSGSLLPIRRSETVLELTYQAVVAPWLTVQPDFQYVFNPGGSVPSQRAPSRAVGDAAVLGLRTTIVF